MAPTCSKGMRHLAAGHQLLQVAANLDLSMRTPAWEDSKQQTCQVSLVPSGRARTMLALSCFSRWTMAGTPSAVSTQNVTRAQGWSFGMGQLRISLRGLWTPVRMVTGPQGSCSRTQGGSAAMAGGHTASTATAKGHCWAGLSYCWQASYPVHEAASGTVPTCPSHTGGRPPHQTLHCQRAGSATCHGQEVPCMPQQLKLL